MLRDQFEWDIANPANSPEDFAETLVADLGLTSEFLVPISHAIREQIQEFYKIENQKSAQHEKKQLIQQQSNLKGKEIEFDSHIRPFVELYPSQ